MKLLGKITALTAVLCTVTSISAYACTGVYVGRDVSEDGSVILARTEDMLSSASKRYIVHSAGEYKAGESYKDAYGLEVKFEHDSYRYSATPGSGKKGIGDTPLGAAGFNERGVAATATVTAYPSEKAIKADPYVKNGLYELSVSDIILSKAATAREGIEIIADIVDKYGSGEGNIVMTADKNEAWYMEIYTGHQYAAIKLPDDMAAVIPNTFMLSTLDFPEQDMILSKNLESIPRRGGFIKTTKGKINLRDTYGEGRKDSNSVRIWGGRRLLHGKVGDNAYDINYDLLFKPSQKIKLKEVMEVTRYRYEDTKYSADLPENRYIRTIATSRQEECHILQIRRNMSVASGCIEWLCLGNAEFAPYIPFYGAAITETPEVYSLDALTYDPGSMYWSSRWLSSISALNRELYGNKIREFYSGYEDKLMAYLRIMDQSMSVSNDRSKTANGFCEQLANDAYNKSQSLYYELIQFITEYEGKDEFPDNTATFEPQTSVEIKTF